MKVRYQVASHLQGLPIFDRRRWVKRSFGEVVQNVNDTCDPAEAGLERFIGLEHLEPGSLHVRTWGNVSDGTTFTRRCQAGQVLFGKRRAYQRKVAVANFDAVVSGDIYVLAPKGDQLLPELIPFLCLSERFYQHAVGTSAGSLSPRTNWSSLSSFEFAVPPVDQQQQIAKLLWSIDDATQATVATIAVLSELRAAAMDEYTRRVVRGGPEKSAGKSHPMLCLGDVVSEVQYGISCQLSDKGTYPVLRMMNYDEELVAATQLKFVDLPEATASDFEVKPGDILFNRTNSADLVGKVGIFRLTGSYLFASYLIRIQTDTSVILPEFLNYFLNSQHGQNSIRTFVTPGVSQSNVSASNLKRVKVPVPSIEEQQVVVQKLDDIAVAYRACRSHLSIQSALSRQVSQAIFGGSI